MPQIGKKRERRRHSRNAIDKMVPILWEDEKGRETLLHGRLIDVSVSGARIFLTTRMPARALVSFNCPTLSLGGRGTVRYCNPAKGGYEVGLELSNGTGWRDQNRDLENLAAALDRLSPATQPSETPVQPETSVTDSSATPKTR